MNNSNVLQIINQMEQAGTLRILLQNGIVSAKAIHYRDIFLYVESKLASGVDKMTAVTWAQDTFECSQKTVYNALNAFR